MRLSGIYSIKNSITNTQYIGSSVDVEYRWKKQHVRLLRNNKHDNTHLQNAWNKYGEDAFQLVILEVCEPELLLVREQHHIDSCVNGELYNIVKIVNAPFRGRTHSIDSKVQISQTLQYRQFSESHRLNLSKAMSGKVGHKAWNKGLVWNDEVKQKVSNTKSKKLWRFVDPSGTVYEFHNLTKFCKERGLSQSAMCAVGNGLRKQNNGWSL